MATDPVIAAILRRIDEAPKVRIVQVVCTNVSPLEVMIAGQGPIPAMAIAGHVFAVDDTGIALWSAPMLPICFKTT